LLMWISGKKLKKRDPKILAEYLRSIISAWINEYDNIKLWNYLCF